MVEQKDESQQMCITGKQNNTTNKNVIEDDKYIVPLVTYFYHNICKVHV